MDRWYFETSAINFFAKNHSPGDAIATKAHQALKGRRWMISPVCIWEILATSDSFEKEKLIYMSQNLFDSELLPGPGELILKYIFQGCPKVEKRRDLVSESDLAGTWKNLVDCTEKTFVYKKDELDAIMSALKDLNRIIFGLAKNQPEYFSETIESSTLRFLDAEINKISHCCPTNPNQKMA